MNTKNKDIQPDMLFDAVLSLKTRAECEAFFKDLCTMSEIHAMVQRLWVAQLLKQDMVYSDIVSKTGASSATISRVSRFLNYGNGGYETVLSRIHSHSEDKEAR